MCTDVLRLVYKQQQVQQVLNIIQQILNLPCIVPLSFSYLCVRQRETESVCLFCCPGDLRAELFLWAREQNDPDKEPFLPSLHLPGTNYLEKMDTRQDIFLWCKKSWFYTQTAGPQRNSRKSAGIVEKCNTFPATVGTQMLSACFCHLWDKVVILQPCQRGGFCPWWAQCDKLTPRNKPQRRQRVRARLPFCLIWKQIC